MTVAFVAGATGYVGRSVVAELRQRGVDTVAHVRPDSSRLEHWRQRFSEQGAVVDSTPWELAAIRARMAQLNVSLVFALLGTTRARAREAAQSGAAAADYEAVDYGLSSMLLQAAAGLPTRARFVYLSSAGVRDDTENAYLAARSRVERELRGSGLHYVIARPAFITGADREEDRPVERWSARVGDFALGVLALGGATSLQARWASITGAELARGLVRLALDPAVADRIVYSDALRD